MDGDRGDQSCTSDALGRSYPDLSPRDPTGSALHAILREHLATFLAERDAAGASLPKFVEDELHGVLDCGVLAKAGCAHFECDGCGLSRVVGLSCKGRGFCPRCCGRRMSTTARELAERVFPAERTRQWVLSFPFALRWALAFHHDLALALTRITHAEIDRRYRRLAREAGLREPRGGAFFAIQRFGSDLRLNVHLHSQFLDGAYGTDRGGREVFFTAPAPSPEEVAAILSRIVTRTTALLDERGQALGDVDEDQRSLARAYGAAITARGTAKHAPDGDDDELAGQVILPTRRKARIDGFDLDAEVAIAARDQDRRENIFRYFLRPPLSHDRLRYLPAAGGRVILELKKPWHDGSTHVEMTPATFLGRLASLVPRPRKNTTLYFGVLAGAARGREKIVPTAPRRKCRHEDASWAAMMKHSFGIDVLGCPRCGKRLRLVAVIHDRAEVRRLLTNLCLFSEPIPIRPARAPPDEPPDTFDFP